SAAARAWSSPRRPASWSRALKFGEDRGWKMENGGSWRLFHFLSSILHLRPGFKRFPAAVDPEPVGRVATDGDFKGAVHVGHDGGDGAWLAVFARRDLVAGFNHPPGQADAIANGRVQRTAVTERENRGCIRGGAI